MNQINNIYKDFEEISSLSFLELKQKWDNQVHKCQLREYLGEGGQ